VEKVIVGVCIAVAGWLVTHFSRLHFEKRSAQLSRVNEQLGKLYGPLMATITASHETWVAFSKEYWPTHGMPGYFGTGQDQLSQDELEIWRTWILNVFHPLNEKVERVIIENIHLIDGEDIPEAFTQALAHVSAYRAVIAQWQKGNFSHHVSVNNWPTKKLRSAVMPVFKKLSEKQTKLLGEKSSQVEAKRLQRFFQDSSNPKL